MGFTDNVFSSVECLPHSDQIAINADYRSPLYRIVEKKFARKWIEEGEIRISPLSSYKETSLISRRDTREGSLNSGMPVRNTFHWCSAPSLSLSLSRFPLKCVLKKFQSDHEDECVIIEISNPTQWLRDLDLTVRNRCFSLGWPVRASVANDVAYSDVPDLDFGPQGVAINVAFLKPHIVTSPVLNIYWLEAEARVIWQSYVPTEPEHTLVSSPSVSAGCRVLSQDELWGDDAIPSVRVRAYDVAEHQRWTSHLGDPIGMTAWDRGNSGNRGDQP